MAEQKINGALFRSMVTEGALAIAEKKEQINETERVPGAGWRYRHQYVHDHGCSMTELEKLAEPTLAKAADTAAAALLRGAPRQLRRHPVAAVPRHGPESCMRSRKRADCELALALREGVETAYKAVMKPAEGTILTVSRVAAQHAVEACQAEPELSAEQVLEKILECGRVALEETIHQKPRAGKSGRGRCGRLWIPDHIGGMQDALRGIHKERKIAEPAVSTAADFGAIADEDITFTYCTEFIAARKDKARNVGRLRAILNDIGDSLVVVEDDDIVKVHVHTDQPNKALEEGLKFGPLLTVKIENMREQHTAKVIEGTADAPRERVIVPAEKKFGFVSVAAGEGLKALFTGPWGGCCRAGRADHEPVYGRHCARSGRSPCGDRIRAAE